MKVTGCQQLTYFDVLDDGQSFLEDQFKWSAAPTILIRLSYPLWPMTTDPPNKADVLRNSNSRSVKNYQGQMTHLESFVKMAV